MQGVSHNVAAMLAKAEAMAQRDNAIVELEVSLKVIIIMTFRTNPTLDVNSTTKLKDLKKKIQTMQSSFQKERAETAAAKMKMEVERSFLVGEVATP